MTNQELNEAVARKLGVKLCEHKDGWPCPCGKSRTPAPYSTSIEAAWEIMNFIIGKGGGGAVIYSEQRKLWEAALTDGKQIGDFIETADTAPLAICKAFLKLP